ncbi:MAG: hypothetical protein P1V13_14760 [Rhizobiaceae bacterium]|nr:hypothetical protein [Rhizobiaceae bacterium]
MEFKKPTRRKIWEPSRWFLSLGAKMLRVAPAETVLIVFSTFVSQVALVISLLLPLKIVILMGGDGTPIYFPGFMQGIETKTLVLGLGTTAVLLFVLHAAAERIVARLGRRGSAKANRRSAKLAVLSNQDEVMRAVYERVAMAIASILFAGLALVGVSFLYPQMAFLLAGSLAFYAVIAFFTADNLSQFKQYNGTAQQLLFLACVGFVIAQFMFGRIPNPLIVIISIILTRQMLGRLVVAAKEVASVIGQRAQISALFFHGHVLRSPQRETDLKFWPSLDSRRRNDLISSVVKQATDDEHVPNKVELHNSGQNAVLLFTTFDELGHPMYMLKVYESNRGPDWVSEFNLLSSLPEGTPLVPRFLGSHNDDTHLWLVFEPLAGSHAPISRRDQAQRIMQTLWTINPPKRLAGQYLRTHPLRYQRLDEGQLEKLRILSQLAGMEAQYESFLRELPAIKERLVGSRLVLTNHRLLSSVHKTADGYVSTDWSTWAVEPIGSGWPLSTYGAKDIEERLAEAAKMRPDLASVTVADVVLAARIYELVHALETKRWHRALDVVQSVNNDIGAAASFQKSMDAGQLPVSAANAF